MNIRKRTIDKAVAYLNEVNDEVKIGRAISPTLIANKHQLSPGIMKSAIQLGLFKCITKRKYISHIATITPIVARRVIENQYRTTGHLKPEIVNKKVVNKSPKKLGTPKTKSYFWGLIKITY